MERHRSHIQSVPGTDHDLTTIAPQCLQHCFLPVMRTKVTFGSITGSRDTREPSFKEVWFTKGKNSQIAMTQKPWRWACQLVWKRIKSQELQNSESVPYLSEQQEFWRQLGAYHETDESLGTELSSHSMGFSSPHNLTGKCIYLGLKVYLVTRDAVGMCKCGACCQLPSSQSSHCSYPLVWSRGSHSPLPPNLHA